jgi:hypothetical protein
MELAKKLGGVDTNGKPIRVTTKPKTIFLKYLIDGKLLIMKALFPL